MDSYLGLSNIFNLVDASIQSYVQTTYQALSGALFAHVEAPHDSLCLDLRHRAFDRAACPLISGGRSGIWRSWSS